MSTRSTNLLKNGNIVDSVEIQKENSIDFYEDLFSKKTQKDC